MRSSNAVNLFDRQAIMRQWGELGTFDLLAATKSLDTAAKVHDCIGRLLADLVVEAVAAAAETQTEGKDKSMMTGVWVAACRRGKSCWRWPVFLPAPHRRARRRRTRRAVQRAARGRRP